MYILFFPASEYIGCVVDASCIPLGAAHQAWLYVNPLLSTSRCMAARKRGLRGVAVYENWKQKEHWGFFPSFPSVPTYYDFSRCSFFFNRLFSFCVCVFRSGIKDMTCTMDYCSWLLLRIRCLSAQVGYIYEILFFSRFSSWQQPQLCFWWWWQSRRLK